MKSQILFLILIVYCFADYEPTIYCPKFPEPKNGQLECKQGRYCSVLCNVGFTPQYTPAQGYYCDQSSGRWMSFPEQDQIPWPDCVPRTELRIPMVRVPFTQQQQQQPASSLYNSNKAPQPLSLLGSALQILKSFHKSSSASHSQYPYYENYYSKHENNRDNYAPDSRSLYQSQNEVHSYRSNLENRALIDPQYYGENNERKEAVAYVTPNVNSNVDIPSPTFRINGISLDRPQYDFVQNKEREGAKREGILLTTPTTSDNSTTATNDRNMTTTNSKMTDNSTKSLNENSTKTAKEYSTKKTNENSATTKNDRKTTTRHEETNTIDAEKLITKTKQQHNKKNQQKNKKKQKNQSHHHSNNNNNNKEMTMEKKDETSNTSDASREHANKETPSSVNKLSNSQPTKPNNKSNTASDPPAKTDSEPQSAYPNIAYKPTKSIKTDTASEPQPVNGDATSKPNNSSSNNKNLASNPPPSSAPTSKITGYATNLVNNNTETLHYQTLEERRDNRTQQNHIDMINVKQTNYDGSSQSDIENITIATTKGIVPPSTSPDVTSSNTPPHVVSSNISDPAVQNRSVSSSTKENVNKNEVSPAFQVGFRNQSATASSSNLGSKNPLEKNATSDVDEIKPAQTLIHIEIKHAPISKAVNGVSKDLTPNIRQNIEINSEDASELLLNLLKAKKITSEVKDDMDVVNSKQTLDPRILDLMRLREERERELDQTIRKYFSDVSKSHSTTTLSEDNDEELFTNIETPVPMFSARDLRLLRRMVENSKNKKRSGLNNPAVTLWEKMLELTAERKHFAQEKGRLVDKLASRKKLAEGDSSLAKAIMQKVNKVDRFSFEDKPNPFLRLLKKQALKKLQNFYADTKTDLIGLKNSQTDTDLITSNENDASHAINTFINNNTNIIGNNNNININNKHPKQGSRRQYVWNGATFVPMEDRSSPSSYLNTDQGLSERPAYKWNGVSFIENNNEASPSTSYSPTNQITSSFYQPTNQITSSYQSTNQITVPPTISQSNTLNAQDVQNILSQWNSEQNNRLVPQPHAIEQSSSRSEPEKPTSAISVNTNTPVSSVTPEIIYEKDPEDSQVLYYWNGASYKPVQVSEKLAPNTLKYKATANGGFELFERKTHQQRHLDDTSTKSNPPISSPPDLQNLESHIENIFQGHYPTNERTTPPPPVPPQTPTQPLPTPSAPPPPPPPPPQPFNPYAPPQNNDNGETNRTTTNTEQSNKNTETEDFEKVVTNDLNIKQAINALTRLFTADDDAKQESQLSRLNENTNRKSDQRNTPIVSSATLRDLEAKQEQIMDILKSITPNKLKEGSREITDKLTNVYYHATPNSGSDTQKDILHPSLIYSSDGEKTSNSYPYVGKEISDSYPSDGKRTSDSHPSVGKGTSDSYLSDERRTSDSLPSIRKGMSDSYPSDGRRTSDSQYIDDLKRTSSNPSYTSILNSRQQNLSPEEVVRNYLKNRKHDSSSLSSTQQKYMFNDYLKDSKQDISSSSSSPPMKNMESFTEPSSDQDTLSSNSKLDQSQIKELLALTKIAELTAIKKEGVSHPGRTPSRPSLTPSRSHKYKTTNRASKKTRAEKQQHTRVKKLLSKKPRMRGLLKFLIRSKKSKDLLKFLRSSYDGAMEKTTDVEKRHELTDKYNKALHRLLQLWNKRLSNSDNVNDDEDENSSRIEVEENES